jgi:hypothetical protein
MKTTHEIGNIGEARVIFEAAKRGYTVCIPQGHDARYDLVVDIDGKLCKVQVKTTKSDGHVVKVNTRSVGKLDGEIIAKKYTEQEVDWIVVYDITTDKCAFVPASLLGTGRYALALRITPSSNNQNKFIRWFSDYEQWNLPG